MENTYFYLIVGIVIVDFLFENYLKFLNLTQLKASLPEDLKGIYDEEKYAKSQEYLRVNTKFSFITSTFNLVVLLVMLFAGGFAYIDNFARTFSENEIVVSLIFFGIIYYGSSILNIPFSYYDTFIIEEKFGFNKSDKKTFFTDIIKSWLLTAIFGGGILAVIVWLYTVFGEKFWILAWVVVVLFTVFIMLFYSNIIVPLFNKQTPLPQGELRNAIEEFGNKVGFKIKNIYSIDGSKRSTKANAYFTGLGSKKRIVLYDTLINTMPINQIVAVLAHEIGHYKKKHTLIGLIMSIIETGLTLYIFSLFVDNHQLAASLGVDNPAFHIGLVAFGILYSPISMVIGLLGNIISRQNEYEADKFAAENYSADSLSEALKKLSVNNLSNLTPHKTYVFFNYSHPPLLERLKALKKIKKQ